MNYSNFASRVKAAHQKPAHTYYPPALLATVEKLHFEDGIHAKAIAQALLEEPEWQHLTFSALHSAICRHLRRTAEVRQMPIRRKPRKLSRA